MRAGRRSPQRSQSSVKSIPPIKALMTPFPHWIASNRPVREAVRLMAEHGISHLAIKDGSELVGVVTERDIQNARNLSEAADKLSVGDVGQRNAYVVELSEPLDRVLLGMADQHIDSALVVKDGKLAGIFTLTDACRCFRDLLRSLFPSGGDDAA
jgi:acetoin utilization protein AcuB